MVVLLCFFLPLLTSPLNSEEPGLKAENAALRYQLIVFQRKVRRRVHSRTAIARSSFGCIVGVRRCSRPSTIGQKSAALRDPTRLMTGVGLARAETRWKMLDAHLSLFPFLARALSRCRSVRHDGRLCPPREVEYRHPSRRCTKDVDSKTAATGFLFE